MGMTPEIILRQAQDERVPYHHPLVVSLSTHRVQTISHFWNKARQRRRGCCQVQQERTDSLSLHIQHFQADSLRAFKETNPTAAAHLSLLQYLGPAGL